MNNGETDTDCRCSFSCCLPLVSAVQSWSKNNDGDGDVVARVQVAF